MGRKPLIGPVDLPTLLDRFSFSEEKKRDLAVKALDRRLREQARRNGFTPVNTPRAILDRVQFTAASLHLNHIGSVAGFRCTGSHFIRPTARTTWQAYRRVTTIRSQHGETRVNVLTQPRARWLAPFRVEFVADDATGLLPHHVIPFWELASGQRLRLVELALDFPPSTGIDGTYVRRRATFGKSRTGKTSGDWPNYDTWGTRRGGTFVRSYFKYRIDAHRIEFELRQRTLQKFGVKMPSDFRRFRDVLPGRHFRFVRIDPSRVERRLRHQERATEISAILRTLSTLEHDLHAALSFLRAQRLLNVHRFLVPVGRNRLVRDALGNFCLQWGRV